VTRIGVLQRLSEPDLQANREALVASIDDARRRGVDLLVAPEGSSAPFPTTPDGARAVAEPLSGPFVAALLAATARGGAVVAGMFEADLEGNVFNTVVVVDNGSLVGSYRKIHLFDAFGGGESAWASPGPTTPLRVEVAGLTIGVLTCYDLRFPELSQAITEEPIDLLCAPAGWWAGPNKVDQLTTLAAARAIEGVCALALADQPGPRFCGASMVVDHRGVALARLGVDDEGMATATIDSGAMAEARIVLPVREHRRFRVVPR
jgi:deaminated glutathione amidase